MQVSQVEVFGFAVVIAILGSVWEIWGGGTTNKIT